jgi:U4/U6 small nuclear ribonucleoprotein PRP3
VCLSTDSFSIVIVEGGLKSVRRYEKLMMRRIDWNVKLDADAAAGDNEDDDGLVVENKCMCVWKGTTTKPAFKKFRFETLRTEAAARKYLADMNLAHFFDAAAACVAIQEDFFNDDE